MHFSSRSYSYGGLLHLGEHHISTTTLIKSFSGLANDLTLSKFWLKYIWLELIVKDFSYIKLKDSLGSSYTAITEKQKTTELPLDSLCFCVQDVLGNWLVTWFNGPQKNQLNCNEYITTEKMFTD